MKQIMNWLKENQGKSSVLIAVFFLVTVCVFQRPYYFVFYDSEPDYLGNALHIVTWGFPVGAHHPATITYYYLALIIKLMPVHILTVGSGILVLRVCLLVASFFFVYFGLKSLYGKKEVAGKFALAVSFAFLVPPVNFFVDILSAETVLFGLGFIFIAQVYKYVNEGLDRNYLLPVLLGICLSVKLSAISLVIIMALCHIYHIYFLFGQGTVKEKVYHKIKSFLFFYLIMIVTFLFFSLPVITSVKDSFGNLANRSADDFNYKTIFGSLILILVTGILIFKFRSRIKIGYTTMDFFIMLSRFLLVVSLVVWLTYLIKVVQTTDNLTYASFAIATRHLVPLLALIFIPGVFGKFRLSISLTNSSLFFLLLILSALTVKILMNRSYTKYAEEKETEFNSMINELNGKVDHIMLYPSSEFSSKRMFELWANYRYANGMINFGSIFYSDSIGSKSNLARMTYLVFNDTNKINPVPILSDKKSDTNKVMTEASPDSLRINKPVPAPKRKWYQKITKKDLKDFYVFKLDRSYQPGNFLFRNITGFRQVSSVYNYRLFMDAIIVPNDSLRVGLIVPAFNVDFLYDGKPKGHYFVSRTSADMKRSYIDTLRSKLFQKNIVFKETNLSAGNTNAFLYFQLDPRK